MSEALNQVGASWPSPPCTPGGRGAARWEDCCGYCHRLPKASGHSREGERVLGQPPQTVGGRGSWGRSPGQTPSPGKQAEEPRLAPSGPPGLDQQLWGRPGQVPSPGKDRVPPRQWPSSRARLTRGGGAGDTLQAQSYFPPLSPICHKVASEKGTHVTCHPCRRPRGLPAPTQGAHAVHPGVETGPACRRMAGPRAASPTGQPRATPSSKFLGVN